MREVDDICRWTGVETEVITGYDTRAALAYLLDGDRLAVLPSLVENSPLSILELIGASIPFLASTAGGIPESILEADQVPPNTRGSILRMT